MLKFDIKPAKVKARQMIELVTEIMTSEVKRTLSSTSQFIFRAVAPRAVGAQDGVDVADSA